MLTKIYFMYNKKISFKINEKSAAEAEEDDDEE